MDNASRDESVHSVDKEAIHLEHDYCRARITCHTEEKKDHGLDEKFTEHAVEKWTDSPTVQSRNDDDRNKCRIPVIMGEVLSRASTIFRGLTPNNLLNSRKKNSAETPVAAKTAEPEESSEITSQKRSISESETSSAYVQRIAANDSGMISQESELSESITPDFEFLRDVSMQAQPAQHLTPSGSSPACRETITPVAMRDTSIHSQPTQILTEARELLDFRHAFGSMLPSNFSNSSFPPPSHTPYYSSSDTREGVVDADNFNNASPLPLTPYYLLSDSERTARAEISDTSEGDADLETQCENSKCGSPPLFPTQNSSPLDNQESALIDTSDRRGAVKDLEIQYENSSSNGSPPLFSTQNSPPSDNRKTALTDTSDTRWAVIGLETPFENSSSGSLGPSFIQDHPLSDRQGTSATDLKNNGSCRPVFTRHHLRSPQSRTPNVVPSDTHEEVIDLGTRYDNSNSNGSPPLLSQTSNTREEVIDPGTRYENSNINDSILAQSTAGNLELSHIQRVIDRETGYDFEVTRSARTDLDSADSQRVIDREIGYETSNCLELTGSTASITEFLDTRYGIDTEDLPTQTQSSFRQDVNENLISRNKQTAKRKREEEPESLWTDEEDYSQSGSPVLEIMSNTLGRLPKVTADPCSISIGTNLSAPRLFTAQAQNPEDMSLGHCYSERTKKSPVFRTLELEVPEPAPNDAPNEAVEIRAVADFSGRDTSNIRNFEQRRVRKIDKRKIDFHESKENRPPKKRRLNDGVPRRPTFDSKESPDSGTRRVNLNVPHESDRTGSIEFSAELLSNRCCEYDHIFPNVSSVDDLLYEPILLRHLVEPDYEAIRRKIDTLVTRIEALDDDL